MQTLLQPNFERYAKDYDGIATQQAQVMRQLARAFFLQLPAQGTLVDAGAGSGQLAQVVREEYSGWRIVPCDLSFSMCQIAKERSGDAVNARMEALPFQSHSCDAYFSSLALQWSSDPVVAIAEATRVLKTKGWIALSTYSQGTLQALHRVMQDKNLPIHSFARVKDLTKWCVEAGLAVRSCETQMLQTTHTDLRSLLLHMKRMGANRFYPKGQRVPRLGELRALELSYQAYSPHPDGVAAEWYVTSILAQKGAS
jgi:ubiquinone/menaquinone biosynthesis C-methylase UbiE